MKKRKLLLVTLAGLAIVALLVATRAPAPPEPAPDRPHSAPAAAMPAAATMPPYRTAAEIRRGGLPQVMAASYFRGYPAVERAYQIAARIPEVLAEQPCYCWCDKFGHGSLLDCFATDHGAG
jgi:hypothetical protein